MQHILDCTLNHKLLFELQYNGHRTSCGPILSVIIRVINKICLITSMITDQFNWTTGIVTNS